METGLNNQFKEPDDRDRYEWYELANCKDIGSRSKADFDNSSADSPATRRALAICSICPVQKPCLDEALRAPIVDQCGVRGNMTAPRRQALLRSRRNEAKNKQPVATGVNIE